MKIWRSLLSFSIGICTLIGSTTMTAQAQTTRHIDSQTIIHAHQNYPAIKVEIQGKKYEGIVANNKTYVLWGALDLLSTPYKYQGNGLFSIAGKDIQGIIYKNQTYLPWYTVGGTPIKANHIPGGWNFTRVWQDSATDGYKLQVFYSTLTAQPWEIPPFWIETFKDDGTEIHSLVSWHDVTDTPGYGNGGATGMETPLYFPIWQEDPGHVTRTITWIDPKGVNHTQVIHMTIAYPESSQTPVPTDDKVVVQIPARFDFDQIHFDATVNNKVIHWQLDTGAMTPVINGPDAQGLNLPKLKEITIIGVTGKDTAYLSKMNVNIGGVEFKDVTCIVYPNMQTNSLFGFSFFAENKYDLLVSYKHRTISILK